MLDGVGRSRVSLDWVLRGRREWMMIGRREASLVTLAMSGLAIMGRYMVT